MHYSTGSKKIIASLMALTIVSGAAASNASWISTLIPSNSITASAAVSGNWEYTVQSDNTAYITKYTGSEANIIVPESIGGHAVKKISGIFQSKSFIKSVSLPRGISEIPDYTFNNCANLTQVFIPHGVTKLGWNSFSKTPKLKSISLPTSLKSIGSNAFAESGISSITIRDGVTLGNGVFSNCKNLKSITLPSSTKSIAAGLFSGSGLTSFTVPANVTTIGQGAFRSCSGLTSFTVPNKVTSIGSSAFANCTNLKSISLSSSLKEIGDYAFENTGISLIRIPYTVTSVGKETFKNCSSLSTVDIKATCSMGQSMFLNCDRLTNIQISDLNTTYENALKCRSFKGCKNLSKINNTTIVKYYSNGMPYIDSKFRTGLNKYFEIVDEDQVSFFEEYLKAYIHYVATTETANCKTDGQKIKALHDWVCNKVNYSFVNGKADPSKQCHVDSSVFMRDTTVCDGYARALTLLLREIGIEAYQLSSGEHAWVMVKLGNHYFHVDPTHDDNPRDYDHFLKSDNDIKKCSEGHTNWRIDIPYPTRISYTIPSTMPKCSYSVGDANMDGTIDKKDTDLILKYIAKKATLPGTDKVLADANLDGVVDVSDVIKLKIQYEIPDDED